MAKVNWINGSIKPPKAKVYYVIMECVKDFGDMRAGEIDICSAIWFGDFWDISGEKKREFSDIELGRTVITRRPERFTGESKTVLRTGGQKRWKLNLARFAVVKSPLRTNCLRGRGWSFAEYAVRMGQRQARKSLLL